MKVMSKALLLFLLCVLAVIVGLRCSRIDEAEMDKPDATTGVRMTETAYHIERPEPTAEAADTELEKTTAPEMDWAPAAEYIAKTVYGEAGVCCTTEQAAVVWCILNRVDSMDGYFPDDIIAVIVQPGQFHGYKDEHPVKPELYELALDVIERWQREQDGETDIERVLPADYLFFSGDGTHNYFRKSWRGGTAWDWSLPSPYEE